MATQCIARDLEYGGGGRSSRLTCELVGIGVAAKVCRKGRRVTIETKSSVRTLLPVWCITALRSALACHV